MTTLGLEHRANRCAHGFDLATQHPHLCPCAGLKAKSAGQSRAAAAHPAELASVEAAIRQAAATGQPFSANSIRAVHGVKGGVVGKAFTNMKNAGVIRQVGTEASTDPGTHAHPIGTWIAASR